MTLTQDYLLYDMLLVVCCRPASGMQTITRQQSTEAASDRAHGLRNALGQKTLFVIVVAVALTVLFTGLGSAPLFNPDEGLYAEPAREMLDTGEYMTTLLNYKVRLTKPPLVIWAMALSYLVMGVNEFAARFFSAACGACLVAWVYLFLARYASVTAAVFACLTLLTAPLFVGVGRLAITDMPLSLFIAGSLMCFYRSFREKERFSLWSGYILTGLAVMTKGPVGFMLPVMVLTAYHLLRGTAADAWRHFKPLWGAIVVGILAIPWFAAEMIVTKGAYFHEFILRENFQRFTSVVDSHKGPWWYHLAAMMGGFFPWCVFLPFAFARALASLSWMSLKFGRQRSNQSHPIRQLTQTEDLLFFAALTVLVVLGFFSASTSKLIPYTLPAFPALAILVGVEVACSLRRRHLARLAVPIALLGIAYSIAFVVAPPLLGKLRDAPVELFNILRIYITCQCVVSAVACILMLARRPGAALSAFAAATALTSAVLGLSAMYCLAKEWEGPLPEFARRAASSGCPIVVYDLRKPAVPFYARRQVLEPGDQQQLRHMLAEVGRAMVISKAANASLLSSLEHMRVVSVKGRFLLAELRR